MDVAKVGVGSISVPKETASASVDSDIAIVNRVKAGDMTAFDELASRFHYRVNNPGAILKVSSHLLENGRVEVRMPRVLYDRFYADDARVVFCGESRDISVSVPGTETVLRMEAPRFFLGIGCRKGTGIAALRAAVAEVLKRSGVLMDCVEGLASADLKRAEKGLLEFARETGKELRFFSEKEFAFPVRMLADRNLPGYIPARTMNRIHKAGLSGAEWSTENGAPSEV